MKLHLPALLVAVVLPSFAHLRSSQPNLSASPSNVGSSQPAPTAPVHIVAHFHFTVAAPFARVSPQFGPQAERAWDDPDWDPHFLYPQPARDASNQDLPGKDIPGAVFTVQHGPLTSTWVNTLYDPAAGRMQYVYVIPSAMVTVIDVRVARLNATHTTVHVTYTRTALSPEHNADITHLAAKDTQSGPQWQHYVEHALTTNRHP